METLFKINWQDIFVPKLPIGEIIIRGSVMYLILFVLLRLVQKRQAGAIGITDLLVVVLLADAAQNGLAGSYNSVTEACVLVCTIVFWNYTINWLGSRFPRFQRLIYPPPLPLIKQGKMLRRNMRHELLTEDELMSQLRQQGIKSVDEVQEAYIESDGSISIITYESQHHQRKANRVAR